MIWRNLLRSKTHRRATRSTVQMGLALTALSVVVQTSGCIAQTRISGVFSTNWEDDKGQSIRQLESKLRGAEIPLGTDVAVGTTETGLVGVALGGGSPWVFEHALDSRPEIAGPVVVGVGGGELFALQASTGRLLWKRPATGLALRGAGDDGQITVVALESKGGQGSTLLAVSREGEVLRQQPSSHKLGRPAVVSNIAFVPWHGQYVTAFDVSSGEEVARVTLRHETSHAFTVGKTLYFGENAITRFDDQIGQASLDKATTIRLPDKQVAGGGRWLFPASDPRPVRAGGTDKARVVARPSARTEPAGFSSGKFYSIYYRLAHGYDSSATLNWVYLHRAEIIGGSAFSGGLAVCDTEGKITFLEADTGLVSGEVSLGQPVGACVVQTDGFTRAASGAKPKPLTAQIEEALDYSGSELMTAQRLLLDEANKLSSDEVTRMLIEMCLDPKLSPVLLPEVTKRLSQRKTGVEHMLKALSQRYDFLRDNLRPPPVAPLADALAEIGEKRAAPLLAKHLNEPETPAEDLRHAAAALEKLATESELPELERFFLLNRFVGDDDAIITAVVSVAKTMLKVGGNQAKVTVARAVRDTSTSPPVKQRLAPLAEGVLVPVDPPFDAAKSAPTMGGSPVKK